jgi:hypothetical protein
MKITSFILEARNSQILKKTFSAPKHLLKTVLPNGSIIFVRRYVIGCSDSTSYDFHSV